jgi:hypothetical protein
LFPSRGGITNVGLSAALRSRRSWRRIGHFSTIRGFTP